LPASAFLFDLDGTLVTSEPLKGLALAQTCRDYGGVAEPSLYGEVMGENWRTVVEHFFHAAGIAPDYEAFSARFRKTYARLLDEEVALSEGARELIAEARGCGIRIGLVSSAAAWMVDRLLAKFALVEQFDAVVAGEHVARHKPDPESYLLALEQLQASPGDTVVFEDSTAGVLAATAAGCRCIAVRHALNATHDFSAAQRTITSFNELLGQAADLCAQGNTP
jgi:HAD superfamily hydrolase (TIGR01509 family)